MAEEKETYCRLCAEPTPIEQLISAEDDVAISSKVLTKMSWINIDTSTNNQLPNTICFSCFDLLEKTWSFLHNVRQAQEKLKSVFCVKSDTKTDMITSEKDENASNNTGKPVNADWEKFSDKKEVKIELDDKIETITTVDTNELLNGLIKMEPEECYDDGVMHVDGFNSTDSDEPLHLTVKKKKVKKHTKLKLTNAEAITVDASSLCITWNNYMYRCSKCNAQCKDIDSLRLHSMQIHNTCCKFKCSDCSKVLPNYRTFISHVRMHKKLLRYCCEYCNEQFTMKSEIKEHRKAFHSDIFLTVCQNCGMNFETPDMLEDHILMYSKVEKRRRQRTVDTDLKCELCDKAFKSKSNLLQHKLVHTERSRDFSCHVCGKMFFTKGTLSTHMATHEDTKPFKCEFCFMTFRARGNLHSHISLHSGAKPFVCEACGKSFRAKRHLKSHSIVHTDLMPFVCEYCNKTFRFKTRLNLHLRQHTGAKPYTCLFCQRNFTNGSNYKKHMKRRHNIDTSVRNKYNVRNNFNDENNVENEDRKDITIEENEIA